MKIGQAAVKRVVGVVGGGRGEEQKRNSGAMWYVPCSSGDATKTMSLEERDQTKVATIAHGKWRGERIAFLKVTIVKGEDLPALDPMGTSDPYCIIKFGKDVRQTNIKQKTLNPQWNETFVYEVDNIPQVAFSGAASRKSKAPYIIPLCELMYYIRIDIWDKDKLNRDDFMGRVIVPLTSIPDGTVSRWYPLGRAYAGGIAKGRILINFTLKALEDEKPITRWIADEILQRDCARLSGFQLPIMSGKEVTNFPGNHEHVEMLLDDVLVEISGHRGLGRIFLTDFRLVIQCTKSDVTSLAGQTDLSMWVALNNIQSVEKGYEEKVIQKTQAGKAGFSDVKTLIIKCSDFRKILLTFIKVKVTTKTAGQPTKNDELDGPHKASDDDEDEDEFLDTHSRVYSSSSQAVEDEESSSNESSEEEEDTPGDELEDVFVDSLIGKESFIGIVHSGCVARMVKIFLKRLRYQIRNVVNFPPSRTFVSLSGQEFLINGWNVYDVESEFQRQKVDDYWRLSKVNEDYVFAPSYPRYLHVPKAITDETLRTLGDFRSKARIPTLTWFNKQNGSFILRCSQPRTGALGNFSKEDEALINAARNCNRSNFALVIFDARSMLAAGGNRLKGKGTEDVNRYKGCKLLFLDIANIHAMRESIDKLQFVCEGRTEDKWLSQLESTQWLTHISNVMRGAALVAHYVSDKGTSVLVHCSDGWDRTPQLTSLAQILLDPYYRTFDGFKVLVEKDWISFGHRFRDRLGDPACPNQRSPVFLQFLECVWQIMQQFPDAFEFTSKYILIVAEHTNSGWFGNFLCDSVKERESRNVMRATVSLWAHFDAIRSSLINSTYQETTEASIKWYILDFYLVIYSFEAVIREVTLLLATAS
eukprot:gene18024-19829_t